MTIWFDLSNSPHINIFLRLIRELESKHKIIITTRPLANTIDLLDLHNLEYQIVGKVYGRKKVKKIFGFFIRAFQLYINLKNKKIDVAISHSSFHSPIVAKLLGSKSIYINDNEHTKGNLIAFLFANVVIIPEFFSLKLAKKQFANPKKTIQYKGIKEGIYLWDKKLNRSEVVNSNINKFNIYCRTEPWTGYYYDGPINYMDNLLVDLSKFTNITIIPRDQHQKAHYSHAKFEKIRVLRKPLDLITIVDDCDLFIGAGGTMTREMAVLGVPVISIYKSKLLSVDKYLIDKKLMYHKPNITANWILNLLKEKKHSKPDQRLLELGKESYYFIKSLLLEGN